MSDLKKQYLPMIVKTACMYKILPEYLVSIARIESNFNPNAMVLSGPDGARGGAYGLCQLTYKTAQGLGFQGDPKGLLYPDVNLYWACVLTLKNMEQVGPEVLDLAACHNSGKSFLHAPHVSQEYAKRVKTFCQLYHNEVQPFIV